MDIKEIKTLIAWHKAHPIDKCHNISRRTVAALESALQFLEATQTQNQKEKVLETDEWDNEFGPLTIDAPVPDSMNPNKRLETSQEHISRDLRDGNFPQRSARGYVDKSQPCHRYDI